MNTPLTSYLKTLLILGLLSVVFTVCAGDLSAAIRVVGGFVPGNSGNINCNANQSDYATIQSAINAAAAGDDIVICPGTYTENITVNTDSLIIRGSTTNRGDVIITNSGDDAVVTITNWLDSITLQHLTILQSADNRYGIYISTQYPTVFTRFENISVSVQRADAVYFAGDSHDVTVIDSSLKTHTSGRGIRFAGQQNGGFLLENSTIEAVLDGISLDRAVNRGITISNSAITSETRYGIAFAGAVNGGARFDTVEVNAELSALYFRGNVNNGIELNHVQIHSRNGRGIDFSGNVYGDCRVVDVIAQAQGQALYFGGAANPVILNSTFFSHGEQAAYLGINNWSRLTMENNCFTTEGNNRHALYINISDSNDATISGNCFYALSAGLLAYVSGSRLGDVFSGNFWDGHGGSYQMNNITDNDPQALCANNCSGSVTPELVSDYRLDECHWNGSAEEVIDSSGNGLHGAAADGASTAAGFFNSAGEFINDESRRVLLPDLRGQLNTASVSVSAWIKKTDTTTGDLQNIVQLGEWSNYLRIDQRTDLVFSLRIGGAQRILRATNAVSDTQWHHVAAVYDGQKMLIYVDGAEVASRDIAGSIDYGGNQFTIGSNRVGALSFHGQIDEVLIFNGGLSAAGVESIRNFQTQGQNWDGSERGAVICGACPPGYQAVEDDFERADIGDEWGVTNKSGSFGNPRIVDGRLRLTSNVGNVATAATLQRLFPSADNLVVLEFDFFAYGGSNTGADGIAVVLSDAAITPEPGGYGGSLGYANRSGISGFAGGWLGIGLDTFGNYSNPSEGRHGGPGFRRNAVALRGSGVGQSGYNYIAGTNTLIPPVRTGSASDTVPTTHHRYRVTIDSRVADHSWVTIERDTGSGYQVLIGPVDVLTQAGQAAVPEELMLTLTGSTGGSNDIHEIDNIQVCALRMVPLQREINHFRIYHDGNGLTCEAEPVQVVACADNSCSTRYQENVSLTMQPATDWQGGNGANLTLNAGEGLFALRRNSAGNVTLGIATSTPTAANVTRCLLNGVEGSCVVSFTDVGIQIDANVNLSGKTPFPTQLAGKASHQGFNAAEHRIRVVRTNTQTRTCDAAVRNQALPVRFSYLLPTGGEGLGDADLSLTAAETVQIGVAAGEEEVLMQFDNNGRAPFNLTFADAGRYQLRARMDIPVLDEEGAPIEDEFLTREDTSDSFVVRPLSLYVDSTVNPRATDASSGIFAGAGQNFTLDFRSMAWSSGRDGNADGRWDGCGQANPGVVSGGYARVPLWNIGLPAPALVSPAGGVPGTLTYRDGDVLMVAGESGIATVADHDEVGIIQYQTSVNFLGETVPLCSPNIGRFTPEHFTAVIVAHGEFADACSGFTYSGQPFTYVPGEYPEMLITARGQSGNQTRNYRDGYVKLTNAATQISMAPATESAQVGNSGALLPVQWAPDNPTLTPNNDGTLNFILGADIFTYVKESSAQIDKFVSTTRLSVTAITDSDNITASGMPLAMLPQGTEIRYGRMVLDNAHGPETMPVTIPIRTEYFSGSSFVPNAADNCTTYVAASASLGDYSGNLTAGDTSLSGSGNLIGGVGPGFTLSAPGEGNHGVAYLEYNLVGDLPWLQFDWNADGTQTNPKAKATFGIFRGNPRMIYMRESVW